MSGIMFQLILIQPTMEAWPWAIRNPPRWLKAHWFLQDTESSWKDMKKISTVVAVTRNTKTPIKPVLDPNRFSTWNKLLLTLATGFNLIYSWEESFQKSQYTKEDVCLSQNFLLKLAQNNAFSSTINALKSTKVRCQEQIEKLKSNNWPKRTPAI